MARIHDFDKENSVFSLDKLEMLDFSKYWMFLVAVVFHCGLDEEGRPLEGPADDDTLAVIEAQLAGFMSSKRHTSLVMRNKAVYLLEVSPRKKDAHVKWFFVQKVVRTIDEEAQIVEAGPEVDDEDTDTPPSDLIVCGPFFHGQLNRLSIADYVTDAGSEVSGAVHADVSGTPLVFFDQLFLFERKAIKRNRECSIHLSAVAFVINHALEVEDEGYLSYTEDGYLYRVGCMLNGPAERCTLGDAELYRFDTSALFGEETLFFSLYIEKHLMERSGAREGLFIEGGVFLFGCSKEI